MTHYRQVKMKVLAYKNENDSARSHQRNES